MRDLATTFIGFTKKEENEKIASVFTTYFVFYMHFFSPKMIFVLLLSLSVTSTSATLVFAQTAEPPVFVENFFTILMSEDEEIRRGLEACSVRFRERLTATGQYQEQNSQETEEIVTSCSQEGASLIYECVIENIQVPAELALVLSVESFQQQGRGFIFDAYLTRTMNETTIWGSDIHIENEDLIIFAAREACDELSLRLLETLNPNSNSPSQTPIISPEITSWSVIELINISPNHVMVEIDGVELGETPDQFSITPGLHTLTLSEDGYRSLEQEIQAPENGILTLEDLTLAPTGVTLMITSNIAGAAILIDGEQISTTIPGPIQVEVSPNASRLEVQREGYTVWDQELNLDPEETASFDVELVLLEENETIQARHVPSIFRPRARRLRRSCDNGNMNDCVDLGGKYRFGRGVKQDYEEAVRLYQFACNGGEVIGCNNLQLFCENQPQECIRLYQIACDGGDSNSCLELTHLGNRYRDGRGVAQNYQEAIRLYQIACNGGDSNSCLELTNLGNRYRDGRGVVQNYEEAARLFRFACDNGNMVGCSSLGNRYRNGRGVEQNYQEAVRLYQLACDSGEMAGCDNLQSFCENQPRECIRVYQLACDNGEMLGCGRLGNRYRVAQDYQEASRLYQVACNGGDSNSCLELTNLGNRYRDGEGVEQDYQEAVRLYQFACDNGDIGGCFDLTDLGDMYRDGLGVTQDYEEAARLYWLACDGGKMIGCSNLGDMYRSGEGIAQDYEEAERFFRIACNSGDSNSCLYLTYLGNMYRNGEEIEQDYEEAVRLYQIACEGGEMASCNNLGYRYRNGEGVEQDYEEAVRFFNIACDNNEIIGCSNLGDMYQDGLGVAQDYEEVVRLYRLACNRDSYSCSRLIRLENLCLEEVEQNTSYRYTVRLHRIACDGGNSNGCIDLRAFCEDHSNVQGCSN